MMHDDLFALQQKVAKKPLLESKLYELHTQRRQYDNQVISLRVAFRKEQEDVEKLEGRSLTNYFYQVIGKLDDKLDQERKEAYAAKVKLDAAERELAGIESDIKEIQEQITDVLVAEARYKDALELKRRNSKTPALRLLIRSCPWKRGLLRFRLRSRKSRKLFLLVSVPAVLRIASFLNLKMRMVGIPGIS